MADQTLSNDELSRAAKLQELIAKQQQEINNNFAKAKSYASQFSSELQSAIKAISLVETGVKKVSSKQIESLDIAAKNVQNFGKLETSINKLIAGSNTFKKANEDITKAEIARGDVMKKLNSLTLGYVKKRREEEAKLDILFEQRKNQAGRLEEAYGELTDRLKEQKDLEGELADLANRGLDNKNVKEAIALKKIEVKELQETIKARNSIVNNIEKELSTQRSLVENINDALNAKNTYKKVTKEIIDNAKAEVAFQEDFNKKLGITGDLVKGLDTGLRKAGFTGLADRLGLGNAVLQTRELYRAAKESGEGFSVLGTFAKQVGANLKEALGPVGLIVIAVEQLKKAFDAVDKGQSELARNFGISRGEAGKLRQGFEEVSGSSNSVLVTTKGIQEAFIDLNSIFGTNVNLSKEQLAAYTELNKVAGIQKETLGALSKIGLGFGQDLKGQTASFLGQVKASAAQKGLLINERQLMNEIGKLSSGTLILFRGQSSELAKAAVAAKALGTDLATIDKVSSSLLNFEQSIGDQFEAELLTGRDLNLERARALALNNDLAGVAQELANQGIKAADYAGMNRIQQESLAKSLGLSRDEMSKMLMEQEAMSKLSGVEGKSVQERYNNLVKTVGVEAARKRLGDDALAAQLQQASVQEKLAAAQEKFTDLFVKILEPLVPLLDAVTDALGPVFTALNSLISPIVSIVKLVGDALKPAFAALTPVLNTVSKAIDSILTPLMSVVGPLLQGFLLPMIDAFSEIGKQITNAFEPLGKALSALTGTASAGETVKNVFKGIGQIAGTMLLPLTYGIQVVVNGLTSVADMVSGVVKLFQGDFLGGIKQISTGLISFIFRPLTAIWDIVKGVVGGIVKGAATIFGFGPKDQTAEVNKTAETTTPKTKMADGGVVNKPTNALIGEAGPEMVIPLSQAKLPDTLTPKPVAPIISMAEVAAAITSLKATMNEIVTATKSSGQMVAAAVQESGNMTLDGDIVTRKVMSKMSTQYSGIK
jgi:hypothetical protein